MAKQNRAVARLNAVQALYQMDVGGKGLGEASAEFERHWTGEIEGDVYAPAEFALFKDILQGVLADQAPLDRMIDEALQENWPLRRIEAVMRAVLRAGAYELKTRPDVPARVAVTEYVDVAAAFLARDEVGMVNAVLDRLGRDLRPTEFEARR
jgi:transcription antitermination protein NusB